MFLVLAAPARAPWKASIRKKQFYQIVYPTETGSLIPPFFDFTCTSGVLNR